MKKTNYLDAVDPVEFDTIEEEEDLVPEQYNIAENMNVDINAIISAEEDIHEIEPDEDEIKDENVSGVETKSITETIKKKIKRFGWRNDAMANYIIASDRCFPVKGRP